MKKLQEKIKTSYIDFLLEKGKRPASVATFCKTLEIKEKDFYDQYSSFNAIEQEVWEGFIAETLKKIQSEEVYQEYTVQEKLLSFYYTLIEILKTHRSFVVFGFKNISRSSTRSSFLSHFKSQFKQYAGELMTEGMDSNEVATRFFVTDGYPGFFWLQAMTIIRYWINDQSSSFEDTDAFIEKSVNLSFDLVGRNFLDSSVDYAKFFFQSR